MATKTIKKYLKIYWVLLKFSVIQSTTYRTNFFMEVLIELGYQIGFLLFFFVLFGHISEIAGWSYYEIVFLAGVNMVYGGLLWGMVFVFCLSRLPEDIKNGSVDMALLKPLHPLFSLTLGKPYFTSLLSLLPGAYLIYYSLSKLHRVVSLTDALFGIVIFCSGMVIAYSIAVILSSASFRFLNSATFPQIIERVIDMYTRNPHSVYHGVLRIILFFVVPLVFVASIPSSTILRGVEYEYVFLSIGLAAAFLCMAIVVWGRMIRYYSSASS